MELLPLLPLAFMIHSDFDRRRVKVWCLLLFGGMQYAMCWYTLGFEFFRINLLHNGGIVVLGALLIVGYAFLVLGITYGLMGCGDLCFMLFLAPMFCVYEFIFFLTASFSATLFGFWTWNRWKKREERLPLVSTMGLCYGVYIVYSKFFSYV